MAEPDDRLQILMDEVTYLRDALAEARASANYWQDKWRELWLESCEHLMEEICSTANNQVTEPAPNATGGKPGGRAPSVAEELKSITEASRKDKRPTTIRTVGPLITVEMDGGH